MRLKWSNRRRVLTGCAITGVLLPLLVCGSLGVAVVGMSKSVWFGNGTSYVAIGQENHIMSIPDAIFIGPNPFTQTPVRGVNGFKCVGDILYPERQLTEGQLEVITLDCHP